MSQWIKRSEQTPDPLNKRPLIVTYYDEVSKEWRRTIAPWFEDRKIFACEDPGHPVITHWMLTPEDPTI